MITPKELTAKLRSVPEAKGIFDQAAELPLRDAAYVLLRNEYRLDKIEFETGLRNAPFIDDAAAQPVQPVQPYIGPRFHPRELMFHRLKAVHPDASDGRLRDAIEAAQDLYSPKAWPLMDYDLARLREERSGFEQETYKMAYHDFRVANR